MIPLSVTQKLPALAMDAEPRVATSMSFLDTYSYNELVPSSFFYEETDTQRNKELCPISQSYLVIVPYY